LFSCRKGTFLVVGPLEEKDRVARCVRVNPAEARRRYTSPSIRVVIEPLLAPDPTKGVPERATRVVRGATRVAAGRVAVTERVVGYVSSVRGEHSNRAERQRTTYPEPLFSGAFVTDGVWWRLPRDALLRIPPDKIKEAAWGVLNLVRAMAPSAATCDARDVGGTVIVETSCGSSLFDDEFESTNAGGDDLVVTLCLYDAVPGGVGLASRLFQILGDAWDAALDAVSKCACLEGCPSCVRAGRATFVETDKKYARVALEAMTAAWLRGA